VVRWARSGALKPADVEDVPYTAAARNSLVTDDGER
jgi:hypothetical protein